MGRAYEVWEIRWDDGGRGIGELLRLSGLDDDQARLVCHTMTTEEKALMAYVAQGGWVRLHSRSTFEVRRDGVRMDLPACDDGT